MNCEKEYFGGYDELVECNQELIAEAKELATEEIGKDLQKELNQIFQNAVNGHKSIKFN